MLDSYVWHVLEQKGSKAIWTISPDASVRDAALKMGRKRVGALLVVRAKKLAGIISERECVRRVMPQRDRVPSQVRVEEVMQKKVVCVATTATVEQCFAAMTFYRTRHVVVVDGRKVVGLVSIGDVVKFVIADQQFAIRQLEQFICGGMKPLEPKSWVSWEPGKIQRHDYAAGWLSVA